VTGTLHAADADGETAAVRARIDSYVAAFNRGDVAAAAAHWDESAEYVLPDSDQRIHGREAIRAALETLSATGEPLRLALSGQRIRLVNDSVAVEEGLARLVSPDKVPEQADYTAIHVKKNGTWYRESVRETLAPVSTSNHEGLASLAWMVGTWQRQDENESLIIRCQWTHNNNFLSRSFKITSGEGEALTGTQVIGWDASSGSIRSWSFDSEGGFEEAVWHPVGDRWSVKVAAVLPDGRAGFEQRIVTPIGDNTFTWKAVDRQIDGTLVAATEEVTVTRAE
jgi:uncharacterized protein (TIGR02246 family)